MERLLPNNSEAECGVLGSLIIDPEAVPLVADWLHPDDLKIGGLLAHRIARFHPGWSNRKFESKKRSAQVWNRC